MNRNILLVDDEPSLLDGLRRLLAQDFVVRTAGGGDAGIDLLAESEPFAVVMSDMRMPGMDGIQFLRAVRDRWPDTVRLILTGKADIQTAIDAVNEGSVFRFLTKPCPEDVLRAALNAAIAQFELITAEKELLEKTLHGSVKVLTEVLALVNPAAFSRATRVHRTVKHMARHLNLRDSWRYEVAAMLSQVGCVAFDTETVEAVYSGADLPIVERERFNMHPSIAFELLSRIPRLESVAKMIAGQQGRLTEKRQQASVLKEPGSLGAHLLKIAVDFDQLMIQGASAKEAHAIMTSRPEEYDSKAVAALEKFPEERESLATHKISIREIGIGMILDEDLRSANGILMVARDQEITYPLLVRIRNLHQKSPFPNSIRVKVPEHASKEDTDTGTVVKTLR